METVETKPLGAATDQDRTPEPDGPSQVGDLGLALSGGGVRATLFSLGVLIGLIETNCHRRVRCIASVSGGSILNAAMAHGPTLCNLDSVEKFRPLASQLASSLAWSGVFAWSGRNLAATSWFLLRLGGRVILPLVIPALYMLGMAVDAIKKAGFWETLVETLRKNWYWLRDFTWQHPLVVIGTLLAWVMVAFFLTRGLLQEAEYRSLISKIADPEHRQKPLTVDQWGQEPSPGNEGVMHVLVATDLLSGAPLYFSREFIYCAPYGWSRPRDVKNKIKTSVALYSSAAFPAVFPPKRIRLRTLNFQNGESSGVLPRSVRLVDGGVYNNLGTDWFSVLEQQRKPPLWPFGEIKVIPPKIERQNVVVVNAGAPSSDMHRLLPYNTIPRIMSVLYDNTVRPRIDTLHNRRLPLIDIAESPITLAERLKEQVTAIRDTDAPGSTLGDEVKGAPNGALGRAEALLKTLNGKTPEFWADLGHHTAGTATKLSRAGERAAARLMLHGYLSSLVLFHVVFGAKLPSVIRGEEYFLSLARPDKSATDDRKADDRVGVDVPATHADVA
jgi:predicted acylesterase/phospholipase RssA